MSDLVSRLAARAVGEPLRAQPAVASADLAGPAPEPAAELLVARATPAATDVRSEVPGASLEQPPEPKAAARNDTTAPAERSEAGESRAVREQAAATELPRDPEGVEPVAAAPAKRPEPRPANARRDATIVAAVPVPAAPIVRSVLGTRLERVNTVSMVAADEPPVRVHIGRLEVRANLEQPASKPERRAERGASGGLSLSEYLRGRRTA